MLAYPSNAETESCEDFQCQTRISAFVTNSHYSQLNHGMRNLVDTSPTIQYRVELFAASLIGGSQKPSLVVADRRALLERYHSRWDKLQGDKWWKIDLPARTNWLLEGDVLGLIAETRGDQFNVHFIQLPSASRGVLPKRWVVRGLPRCDTVLKINPEADLLVVPEVVNEGRYVIQSFGHLHGDDSRLSTFRIRILRLSDGLPHPLAPIDPVICYESNKILSSLEILVSGHRLVAIAAFKGAPCFGRHNTLIVWDWRRGQRVLVSSYFPSQKIINGAATKKNSRCWVDQVQFVGDHRIIAITRPKEQSTRRALVVWDTTTAEERKLIFEMPTKKADMLYKPKSLVGHSWASSRVGLHRSDSTRRVVGILCRGTRGKVHENDDYMITINAADIWTYAPRKSSTTRIPWQTWERSTTVIQIALSVTETTAICGCRLFAMTKGFSGWNFIELLRIYDFSAGTRSGRNPNRPPVRDVLLNLGRGAVDEGKKIWYFSEDNLILFHVSLYPSLVRG
jgi:hypothetical protein